MRVESIDNKTFVHNAPYEAVADAMMIVQAHYLNPKLYHMARQAQKKGAFDINELYKLLYNETRSVCRYSSRAVLENLYANHSWLFRYFLLLRADKNSAYPFKPNSDWKYHYYFLIQDINGVWHAGSPANYPETPTSEEKNPLTQLFQSPHLAEVIENIHTVNGGLWSSAKKIEEYIVDKNTVKPEILYTGRYHQEMRFAVVRKHDGNSRGRVSIYRE